MTLLLAARPIDFAIFGTLGTLWLGGGVFIFLLYRWIRRFEGMSAPPARPAPIPPRTAKLGRLSNSATASA